MLFLFNDKVVNVASPELRLLIAARELGWPEGGAVNPRDAVALVTHRLCQHERAGTRPTAREERDLAALIIARTGANAALFVRGSDGVLEARLTLLPETVLEVLAERVRLAREGRLADSGEANWLHASAA